MNTYLDMSGSPVSFEAHFAMEGDKVVLGREVWRDLQRKLEGYSDWCTDLPGSFYNLFDWGRKGEIDPWDLYDRRKRLRERVFRVPKGYATVWLEVLVKGIEMVMQTKSVALIRTPGTYFYTMEWVNGDVVLYDVGMGRHEEMIRFENRSPGA